MKDNLFTIQEAQTFKAYLEDLQKQDHNSAWVVDNKRDTFVKNFADVLVSYATSKPILPLPNLSHFSQGDLSRFAETIRMSDAAAAIRIMFYNITTWLAIADACINYAEKEQKQKNHDLFSKQIGEMTGYEFQQFLKELNLNIFK